ncbi:MAG: ABC transporter permease [Terrisporobacter sp.]|uniref:ABC transporter permease n=1 Tax=Terrisporobacter sp. TaxID=1965305 RepID=UPI002FCB23DE
MLSVITQSFILAIMALGIYITFKLLDFPDMSADGSYTLGGSVIAWSLVNGINPLLGTLIAFIAGMGAGFITGFLHVKLKITNLLSGILVMGMLYSINLRIMGKSNVPLFTYNHLFNSNWPSKICEALNIPLESGIKLCYLGLALFAFILCKVLLDLFFKTNLGYTIKGVGDNVQMIKSLGVDVGKMKILGLMISNGLIALSGALVAQFQGYSDVNMGVGTLVLGIASIIIGISLFTRFKFINETSAVLIGAFIYQCSVFYALNHGLLPTDLKLITSLILIVFLSIGGLKLGEKFNLKINSNKKVV